MTDKSFRKINHTRFLNSIILRSKCDNILKQSKPKKLLIDITLKQSWPYPYPGTSGGRVIFKQ